MEPKDFQVLISRANQTVTVALVGEAHFDFDAADAHIKTVLAHKPRQVVVNAARLSFISSVGMCFLINLRRAVLEAGGRMSLQSLQPQVRQVLEHTHVIHLFDLPPQPE